MPKRYYVDIPPNDSEKEAWHVESFDAKEEAIKFVKTEVDDGT